MVVANAKKQTIPQGISGAAIGNIIPAQWNAAWFQRFVTQYLQNADIRNATAGPGVTITGNISTPATVTATQFIGDPTSVLGNPGSSSAPVVSIEATANGQVLQDLDGKLLFGTLELASNLGLGASFSVAGLTAGSVLQALAPNEAVFSAMTLPTSVDEGDLWYGSAADVVSALGIGASGQILSTDGMVPEWVDVSSVSITSVAGTTDEIDVSTADGVATISFDTNALNSLLPPQTGESGKYLTTDGTNTSWGAGGGGGGTVDSVVAGTGISVDATDPANPIVSIGVTPAQGDILYYNGSNWAALAPGTSGYVLETQGAAANPTWAAAPGGGSVTTALDQSGGNQTYTIPAGATALTIYTIGGGGGGGGGGKSTTTGTATGGGGGGAAGSISLQTFDVSSLAGPLSVVFSNYATGGAGGSGATVAGSGVTGTAGSNVTIEDANGNTILYSTGGKAGIAGGPNTGGAGGAASGAVGNYFTGLSGAAGGDGGTGGGAAAVTGYGPSSGGGAGGCSGTTQVGGTGGPGNSYVTIVGGAFGTAGGGAGGVGTGTSYLAEAGGGGGGSATGATSGGKGGNGSGYGAGGGGGAGCYNSTGGNGGNAGSGGYAAAIITAFGSGIAGSSANPSATIGLSAVNGTATTFMTSDSAPALSQAISPTWTGNHTFAGGQVNIGAASGTQSLLVHGATNQWTSIIYGSSTTSESYGLLIEAGTNSSDYSFYVQDSTGTYARAIGRGDGLWSFYEPSFGAAALKTVATYDSGSFTGTLTGMTTTTTGTVYWVRSGPMVTLYVGAGFTGTSNANTMTMTGLPTALQPAKEQLFSSICTDSGDYTDCMTIMSASSGTITFYKGSTVILGGELNYVSGQFITSGAKGLQGWSVTYSLV